MQQEKYRIFTFTSKANADTFTYKDTHEGLFVQQEDGTWSPSWMFEDIFQVAHMVQTDKVEEWDWAWG